MKEDLLKLLLDG